MRRRRILESIACWPLAVRADEGTAVLASLRGGGAAVLLRHALTEPGVGDPPGFRLEQCSTQRNLSDAGREQARRIGRWFAAQRLAPSRVRSSPWCRCLETARLAFGSQVEPWAGLASTFGDPARREQQAELLRGALLALPARGFEVWVTHQINIGALVEAPLPMGSAVVLRAERRPGGGITLHNLGPLGFD